MMNRRVLYTLIGVVMLKTTNALAQDYVFGESCGLQEGECRNVANCSSCQKSYHITDTQEWGSGDVKCRCSAIDDGTSIQDDTTQCTSGQEWIYGEECTSVFEEECQSMPGCNKCQKSYRCGDPHEWLSSDVKCRCSSVDEGTDNSNDTTDGGSGSSNDTTQCTSGQEWIYGEECSSVFEEECQSMPGCNKCQKSYRCEDPHEWLSSDVKCRCSSVDEGSGNSNDTTDGGSGGSTDSQWIFGNDCSNDNDIRECNQTTPGCTRCRESVGRNDPRMWDSDDVKCRCSSTITPEFKYDAPCRKRNESDRCDGTCEDSCMMSWRFDGDFGANRGFKQCRCLPEQMAPDQYQYTRNPPAKDKSHKGNCTVGCDCRMSWPIGESRSTSADAMFRCKPAE